MSEQDCKEAGCGFWIELHFEDGFVKTFLGPLRDVDGAYDLLQAYESNVTGDLRSDKALHGEIVKRASISKVISISRDGVELA
jgi:hypothetical protein